MNPNPLLGSWKYRSFLNDPTDRAVHDLLFGEGILTFHRADVQLLEGEGTFGEGYEVRLMGSCGFGAPVSLRWQAIGTGAKNAGWVYDYIGWLIPAWPHGVGQQAAITGSVIRTATYQDENGSQPAGVVASFVAVAVPPLPLK